jgi:exodeoxyribonuclease V alpha subunit
MQIKVTVTRVLFPPPTEKDASWFILATNQGVCKGAMSWRPSDNAELILTGEYGEYKGEKQFNFREAMLDVPTDSRSKLRYVCERTKGIGAVMENAIWQTKGEQWPDVQVGEVPKLNGSLLEEFRVQISALSKDEDMVKAVTWLMSKGATQGMAQAAYTKWEKQTIGIVSDNCYHLAELAHYGFSHVDKEIRKEFGIGNDDPRRIKAAVVYSLRRLTDDGSTVVTWEQLLTHCAGMLGGMKDQICECTTELFDAGDLVGFKGSGCISLGTDYRNEKKIFDFIEGIFAHAV